MDDPYVVKGNCLIIHLDKELDHHLTEQLRSPVDEIIDRRGIRYVIMDFENKSFMDSSGIAVLLRTFRRMGELGGSLRVVHVPDQAGKVLRAAGVDRLIRFE